MMEKITYDFAFPLGAACASSLALRFTGLQFASFPLDWSAGGDVVGRAKLVAEDFKNWLQIDDMELTDVLYSTFNASIYRNRRTGLTFSHDFPAGCYLEDEFPGIAAKYERRIKRLYAEIEKSRRVLVVYNEIPYRPVAAEADILAAQQILQKRFPASRIDLLYFAQDPEGQDREARVLNDNVTMILLNYQTDYRGYVGVAAQYGKMMEFLRDRFEISTARKPEQYVTVQEMTAERMRKHWGTGVQKWINTRVFHLYRHLERFLVKRGCMPNTERPIKLYRERGERRHSLAEPDVSFLPRDEAAARRAYELL